MKKSTMLLGAAIIYSQLLFGQWSLTGNSGTNYLTNFVGTTDTQRLVFRTNNVLSGFLDYSSTRANAAYGYQTLNSLSSGDNLAAFGYQTLYSNTSGYLNTAFGVASMYSNTTGSNNTAYGYNSLYSNKVNTNNTAIGQNTLYWCNGGYQNTALGNNALYSNTTGYNNTASGNHALFLNTTGIGNIAYGAFALAANTTGYSNIAIGVDALKTNSTGKNFIAIGDSALFNQTANSYTLAANVAVGSKALYSNTTGSGNTAFGINTLYSNTTATGNTGIGYRALYSCTTSNGNTAVGSGALQSLTTSFENAGSNTAVGYGALSSTKTGNLNAAVGYLSMTANVAGYDNAALGYQSLFQASYGYRNVAIGSYALSSLIATGNSNVAIGYQALSNYQFNNFNTAVGCQSDVNANSYEQTSVFGCGALGTASYQVRLGNSVTTSIGGYANWTNISDGRVKKNIKENVPGLSFINKLKAVTYNLDLNAADRITKPGKPKIESKENADISSKEVPEARTAKEKIVYSGFVAQDVEKAAKELNYDFSGVDAAKNSKDLYGLRYSDFVVPLVKAVQELSKMNDAKDEKISNMQKEMDELKAMVLNIQNKLSSQNTGDGSGSAVLEQNRPNPFNQLTTIGYALPVNYNSAWLRIVDNNGRILKQINISGTGKGNIKIEASSFSAGTYSYSLFVDNKLIDTKQMILTK